MSWTEHTQEVLDLQWFNIVIFQLSSARKQYKFNQICTLNFDFSWGSNMEYSILLESWAGVVNHTSSQCTLFLTSNAW